MITRVIILDPKLIHQGDHHYVSTSELHHAVRRRGLSPVVFVNTGCHRSIIDELQARPGFVHHLWSPVNAAPGYELPTRWVIRNQKFEIELKQLSDLNLTDADLIILQTASEMNIYGFYQWYCTLKTPRPKISITFHAPDLSRLEIDLPIHHELLRKSLKSWTIFPENEVVIGATSSNLAEYLNKMADVNAVNVPHIIRKLPLLAEKSDSGTSLTVVCPGDFRIEKGYHILRDTLDTYRDQLQHLRFVIQISAEGEHFDKEARRFQGGNVEVVRGVLADDAYLQMLRQADAVLVFYRPYHYSKRVSGVMDESIAMGLPVITTHGTTMAERLAELEIPGVVARAWTKDALFEALMQLSRQYPALKAATLRAATEAKWQGADQFLDFTLDRLT